MFGLKGSSWASVGLNKWSNLSKGEQSKLQLRELPPAAAETKGTRMKYGQDGFWKKDRGSHFAIKWNPAVPDHSTAYSSGLYMSGMT